MSVTITISDAVKRYGDLTIIPGLSATIKNGEFFTLLGPSGCGKTTLLRMIAGFASVEGGEIKFGEKVINNLPAHKRNIGMVFQNYAIFPHLTVRKNVEYGLKLRKIAKPDIKRRTDEILDVVKITEYQDRSPDRLSGGQQQRVALARAIVILPSVLLMDEPLSNLDAKLRIEMRGAIRDIQKKVGITTVYVTHDQEEALAISDRIAVMYEGVIQQLGTPESIYTRPYNIFVSTFIGHSNLMTGKLTPSHKGYKLSLADGCEMEMDNLIPDIPEGEVLVSVRPEEFTVCETGGINFQVDEKVFLGKYVIYNLSCQSMPELEAQLSQDVGQSERIYSPGETIMLKPNVQKINLFNKDTETSLIQGVVQHSGPEEDETSNEGVE
ncbi:MAG: ABC transporter ATP-binding protein [Defluviitaleaceae bacterium]|nr:ABC transporter ATP-binding protein [Defluviitaleaceae bacterium]